VLAINGLGGFAGGIAVKEALLQLEESWDSNLSGQAGD
jgi:O6-methylguanine-DNA--protein-cysteine methyltransferase